MKSKMLLLITTLSLFSTACSKIHRIVTGASLSTMMQNGDDYAQLSVSLDTGSMSLVPLSLPIYNPHDKTQQIGEVDVQVSQINVLVDLTSVLAAQDVSNGKLPNGTAIPVSGVSSQNWIAIPINNGKSTLYLNLDSQAKKASLGVAINIDQLSIGIPADLLEPFSASNISGVAGIYTGAAKGQSGFAVFVDASSLLGNSAVVNFFAQTNQSSKIENKVSQLNSKKAKLVAR